MKAAGTTSLRFGHVTEYDSSRHMARVNFPDLGITSYWLPVLVSNSLKNQDETHLDIGEHVACMMTGEMGVILGAFYDDKNKPQVADGDVRAVTFDDGVRVLYDRKRHELVIDSPEYISVSASEIVHDADRITHSAESITHTAESISLNSERLALNAQSFSVSGGSSGSAGITGKTVDIKGENITITGNIILDGSITLSGSVSCPGWCIDK